MGWTVIAVGASASIATFALFGGNALPTPASAFVSASVGVGLTNGTLDATNLLPGVPTNSISFILTNTGTSAEDFDLQFTGVADTLASPSDLGQLAFLVTTSKGTITYHLDPSAPNSLDPSSPLTPASLERITLPIATGVAPNQQVSIPIAVELANGEGFGNAWNGKSATINYQIVASQSAPTAAPPPITTPRTVTPRIVTPRIVTPSTTLPAVIPSPTSRTSSTHPVTAPVSKSQKTAPIPLRLITGPPTTPLNGGWEVVFGGGLLGLGIAGISVLEVNRRRQPPSPTR
ncbi:hypothetical protein [Ferrimicrobium sp.]|uniref:hypothetical protein n=1 Tax=Ferrimicrobium sp. TaxID=2926050 RepID=UPI0026243E26|nr:hypothetical protein [Ferrimicrobium sp.]